MHYPSKPDVPNSQRDIKETKLVNALVDAVITSTKVGELK